MADQPVAQPPAATALVDAKGMVTDGWLNFFASLVAAPPVIVPQTLTGSPFSFTASHPGHLLVKAGTVTSIVLTRGRVTITTGLTTNCFIPVGRGDQVVVTYTVVPSVWFVPFQ